MGEEEWRVLDFRTAEPGWSIAFFEEGDDDDPEAGMPFKAPLVGWLIQVNQQGLRRVVPAELGDEGIWEVAPIGDTSYNRMEVLAPGEALPTVDRAREHRKFCLAMRQRRYEIYLERAAREDRSLAGTPTR